MPHPIMDQEGWAEVEFGVAFARDLERCFSLLGAGRDTMYPTVRRMATIFFDKRSKVRRFIRIWNEWVSPRG